jgi:hypothetical protein
MARTQGKLVDAHKRMTDEHIKHVEDVTNARKEARENAAAAKAAQVRCGLGLGLP